MCDANRRFNIGFIKKQFLCCMPVSKIRWLGFFDNLEWEEQQILINETVSSELVLKHPVRVGYQVSFLKFILRQLNEQGTEVHDGFYNALGRLMAAVDSSECFKHYPIGKSDVITLRESPNIISEGTTGLCSWQASIALAEWCLRNKILFADKVVLELGSGVGLTGLSLLLQCEPKKVYLSDCHQLVLQTLCRNICLNLDSSTWTSEGGSEILLSKLLPSSNKQVVVLNLPWEGVSPEICQSVNPDLLLAADVVYDNSLFKTFVSAVLCFLNCGRTKELILACTERNKNTLGEFLDVLDDSGLCCRELEPADQNNFVWCTGCPIRIFSVTRRE